MLAEANSNAQLRHRATEAQVPLYQEGMLEVVGTLSPQPQVIFPVEAQTFLTLLCANFAGRIDGLLTARAKKQSDIDTGKLPDFLEDTLDIREGSWKVLSIPQDLRHHRIEVVDSSGNRLTTDIDVDDCSTPSAMSEYNQSENVPTKICRVRGLHQKEHHVRYNGQIISGALLDFSLYFYNNYRALLKNGSSPYFYISGVQSHLEAQWWSEVFHFAEDYFGLDTGVIKAVLVVDNLPAIFELDEMMFYLKEHAVGLELGSGQSICNSSLANPNKDTDQLTREEESFISAATQLLARVCYRRGTLAQQNTVSLAAKESFLQGQEILNRVRIACRTMFKRQKMQPEFI